MSDVCSECGKEFQRIGQHWGHNPSHQPEISEFLYEVLTGVVMGDGSVKRDSNRNPYIRVRSITKEYLEYLDDLFGMMSLGVKLRYTAEEKARENRDRNFSPDADASNYSDQYIWRTRRSEKFRQYENWYTEGKKVYPEIELTPTILRHWYVCDGHYHNSRSDNYISISCSNEQNNKDKVEKMFSNIGYDVEYWNESTRNNGKYSGTTNSAICFNVQTSKNIFNYIGEPIPGFEYKWPDKKVK